MNGEIQAKTTEQKHAKKLWKSANKFRRGGGVLIGTDRERG